VEARESSVTALRGRLQLLALLLEHRFAAELDLIAPRAPGLDQNLIAFLQLVADVLDARSAISLIAAGRPYPEDLDERAESTSRTTLPRYVFADLREAVRS